jgi:hypothetical protein
MDHCVPRPFGRVLVGHTVSTARDRGWAKLRNGDLIEEAERAGYEVLITSDKNLRYQQNLRGRQIAVIELPTNNIRRVMTYEAKVLSLLAVIKPGAYEVVPP